MNCFIFTLFWLPSASFWIICTKNCHSSCLYLESLGKKCSGNQHCVAHFHRGSFVPPASYDHDHRFNGFFILPLHRHTITHFCLVSPFQKLSYSTITENCLIFKCLQHVVLVKAGSMMKLKKNIMDRFDGQFSAAD